MKNKNNESEFVFFNAEFLIDIDKYGIEKLYGIASNRAFTGKFEGMNVVIMPMLNE